MAHFIDLPYEQLVSGVLSNQPKLIREGLAGTKMFVKMVGPQIYQVQEFNSRGREMGRWNLIPGWAYRITPNRVVRLPKIEFDNDPIRRFCRMNGIALTKIVRINRGEQVYFGPAHHQGDSDYRTIAKGEPPVMMKYVMTIGNPARVLKILVVKGEEPKTWEQFAKIAKEWRPVQWGEYKLTMD